MSYEDKGTYNAATSSKEPLEVPAGGPLAAPSPKAIDELPAGNTPPRANVLPHSTPSEQESFEVRGLYERLIAGMEALSPDIECDVTVSPNPQGGEGFAAAQINFAVNGARVRACWIVVSNNSSGSVTVNLGSSGAYMGSSGSDVDGILLASGAEPLVLSGVRIAHLSLIGSAVVNVNNPSGQNVTIKAFTTEWETKRTVS